MQKTQGVLGRLFGAACRHQSSVQPSALSGLSNTARLISTSSILHSLTYNEPAPVSKTERVRSRLTLMAELDASALKDTIVTQFAKSGPPGTKELNLFLDKCQTASDVESALELVQKFRVERVSNHMLTSFREGTSIKLFHACSRADLPEKALEAFVRSNELGLEVSDKVIALLAAQECRLTEEQVDAVMAHYTSKKVAKVSQGAGATSALLATLLKGGEVARALTFVENMSMSGQQPMAGLWPLLIEVAKSAGLEEKALALQQKSA